MVRKATNLDINTISKLAVKLWPNHDCVDMEEEFATFVENDSVAIFLFYVNDRAVGFAQCQLRRDYVEGTESSPVGYLEGIFVEKDFRNQGIARQLVTACEEWAKEKGCTEFASDCELSNQTSIDFHKKVGFKEANRIVCFTKKI